MADKQITPFQLTDQFTMDNFNQRINETNIALQSKPNPNLLDNPYFGNPVDQRGGYVVPPGTTYYYAGGGTVAGTTAAYYTVKSIDTNGNATFAIDGTDYWCNGKGVRGYTGAGYGIDRWAGASGSETFTIENNSVRIYGERGTGYFVQQIDTPSLYAGRTLTASILTADGELITCTGQVLLGVALTIASADIEGKGSLNIYTGGVNLQFHVAVYSGQSISIKAAKLELGSQQTLAHQDANGNWVLNEIPDFGEQMARCQRFRFQTDTYWGAAMLALNTFALWGSIQFPVTMRGTPSIEKVSARNMHTGVETDISAYVVDVQRNENGITYLSCYGNDVFTANNWYQIKFSANADL